MSLREKAFVIPCLICALHKVLLETRIVVYIVTMQGEKYGESKVEVDVV